MWWCVETKTGGWEGQEGQSLKSLAQEIGKIKRECPTIKDIYCMGKKGERFFNNAISAFAQEVEVWAEAAERSATEYEEYVDERISYRYY